MAANLNMLEGSGAPLDAENTMEIVQERSAENIVNIAGNGVQVDQPMEEHEDEDLALLNNDEMNTTTPAIDATVDEGTDHIMVAETEAGSDGPSILDEARTSGSEESLIFDFDEDLGDSSSDEIKRIFIGTGAGTSGNEDVPQRNKAEENKIAKLSETARSDAAAASDTDSEFSMEHIRIDVGVPNIIDLMEDTDTSPLNLSISDSEPDELPDDNVSSDCIGVKSQRKRKAGEYADPEDAEAKVFRKEETSVPQDVQRSMPSLESDFDEYGSNQGRKVNTTDTENVNGAVQNVQETAASENGNNFQYIREANSHTNEFVQADVREILDVAMGVEINEREQQAANYEESQGTDNKKNSTTAAAVSEFDVQYPSTSGIRRKETNKVANPVHKTAKEAVSMELRKIVGEILDQIEIPNPVLPVQEEDIDEIIQDIVNLYTTQRIIILKSPTEFAHSLDEEQATYDEFENNENDAVGCIYSAGQSTPDRPLDWLETSSSDEAESSHECLYTLDEASAMADNLQHPPNANSMGLRLNGQPQNGHQCASMLEHVHSLYENALTTDQENVIIPSLRNDLEWLQDCESQLSTSSDEAEIP